MYIVVSYIITLLIVLLCWTSDKAKLKIPLRALHSRSVFASIVFGIVAVIFLVQILMLVDWLINISFIQSLLFNIMPSANSSGAFFWIVSLLATLVISLAFALFIFLVYNLWLVPVSKKGIKESHSPLSFFNWISSRFYDISEKSVEIKPIAHNIGHWIRYIRNIFLVLIIAEAVFVPIYINLELLIIDDSLFSLLIKSLFMIPVVSYFILNQIVIMLQAEQKGTDILLETEAVNKTRKGDYSVFINLFESVFAGNALISHFVNDKAEVRKSIFSGPSSEHLENADNPELLSAICRNVCNVSEHLSPNYVDALVDLVNKGNVIVMDSYSGEFNLYYLSYLQHFLFLREKALIIVTTEKQVKQVISQYKKIFYDINKIYSIWRICDFPGMPDNPVDADILVCTENQLIEYSRENKYEEFFKQISNVLVFDVYNMLCRDNIFTISLIEELKKKEAQFVFYASENNPDILRAVKDGMCCSDIHMYSSFSSSPNTCVMCWRGESFYKTQATISEELHNDFGIAYTISAIAASLDVSSININAYGELIPIDSYSIIAKSYAHVLAKKLFHKESVRLDSVVKLNPLVAYKNRDLSFDIVYDRDNNLANAVRLGLTECAKITSILHIISRPYMLRDYFAHHIDTMCGDSAGIASLVPSVTGDMYAPLLVLIIKLREDGMTYEQIIEYMESFGDNETDIETILIKAVYCVLGENIADSVYNFFSFNKEKEPLFIDNEYKYTYEVTLTNERVYLKAKLLLKDVISTTGDFEDVLPLSKNVVYNYFLPGQTFALSSRRYLIKSITDGVMKVQLEETVEKEKEYTNYYDISVDNCSDPYRSLEINDTLCELFTARVKREINGYFSHYNGLDFNRANKNTFDHVLYSPIVETKNVTAMRLRIKFPFGEHSAPAAMLFVVLFRGLLETVLPRNYKDIMVVSKIDKSITDEYYFENDVNSNRREDPIPSDWLESKDYEEPLSLSIMKLFPQINGDSLAENTDDELNLYFIEFNENDKSVIESVMVEMKGLLTVLRKYIEWFADNPTLPHAYLKLGYNLLPDIFDIETVYDCLQRIAELPEYEGQKLAGKLNISDPTKIKTCSFCGQPVGVSYISFDDNRIMCEECNKHCTTERKEIEELLGKAYSTLEGMYGITLPDKIKIKFKSADSIRKAHSISSPNARILGVYIPSKNELWVERGGPEACVLSTLIHELTHAWQHYNLDINKLDLMYIEGHSAYVEIECMRTLSQSVYADYWEKCVEAVDNEYSRGLIYWKNRLHSESDKNIFHHMASM